MKDQASLKFLNLNSLWSFSEEDVGASGDGSLALLSVADGPTTTLVQAWSLRSFSRMDGSGDV